MEPVVTAFGTALVGTIASDPKAAKTKMANME
jgi:hypothetical protein